MLPGPVTASLNGGDSKFTDLLKSGTGCSRGQTFPFGRRMARLAGKRLLPYHQRLV